MFAANHYVPVLQWKRAEQSAIQTMSLSTRAGLTPIIQIVSIPVDLDSGDQTKTLEQHSDPALDRLVTVWGTNDAFFLDPAEVAGDISATSVDGSAYVFGQAQARNLRFIPVTGISRSTLEIAAALAHRTHGLCLRLSANDIMRPTLANDITGLVAAHKIDVSQIDIVIDLASVYGQSSLAVLSSTMVALNAIPTPQAWRTLTVVASGFPEHMGVVQTFGALQIERVEWIAWLTLHAQRTKLARLPSFGDYGIQHPEGVEGYDPRYMAMSAATRYTLNTDWLLIKGQSSKVQRMALQYPGLAHQLTQSANFYGQSHCQGCGEVHACANGAPGFGSAEVWRRIGTSHHLTVASAQVAAVPFP